MSDINIAMIEFTKIQNSFSRELAGNFEWILNHRYACEDQFVKVQRLMYENVSKLFSDYHKMQIALGTFFMMRVGTNDKRAATEYVNSICGPIMHERKPK